MTVETICKPPLLCQKLFWEILGWLVGGGPMEYSANQNVTMKNRLPSILHMLQCATDFDISIFFSFFRNLKSGTAKTVLAVLLGLAL